MERNAEKRGYLLEDYRLFHLNDAQGTKIDYHYHEFHKLLLLRSGSGGYTVEGQRYFLEAGDVVVIPSRCVHRPGFESGMPYERTIIYISPEFLSQCSTTECDLQQVFSDSANCVLRPDGHMGKQLYSLADQLEQELSTEGYGQKILQTMTLLRLLIQIGRGFQNSGTTQPIPMESVSGRVRQIQGYIDSHLEEDLSIDGLAEAFFISKYHMMRQFHKETGVSIHTYLSDRRLFLARERIRQGMSATESCFRSGFRSYSSFTRAYAKRFGTTPTGRTDRAVRREETFE